jgi:hypothetical protein
MNPFPYLGDFSEVLPIAEITEYYKSIPYEDWIPKCSPLDEYTYKFRPDYELNHYQHYHENNAFFKELRVKDLNFFPDEWFSKVGTLKKDYQAKIYCTKPGNTEPPHKDFFPAFLGHHKEDGSNYLQEDIDNLGKKIIRCWIPLMDSELGHLLFSEEFALSSWKTGDVYELPAGVTHGFVNAGRVDRYVLVFTGWRA